MSLPSPLLTVPSLTVDQAQFNGLLMGPGTPFGVKKWEALDKPNVRSGNTSRPQSRGSYVGTNLLDVRTITLTLDIGPFASNYGGYGTLAAALAALRKATSTEGTTEYPLWLTLPGTGQVCCLARCTKKSVPWDIVADLGGLAENASVQLEATDPYFYSSPTLAPTIGLPTPGGGMAFPISFPVSFGGGTTANQATLTNSGDVPCYPVLVITGPCLNPSISNQSIAGNPTLSFNLQMSAGDRLVLDCDLQSATYYAAGSTVGATRLNALVPGSAWFSIPPGPSIITFNSQDTTAAAGTLQVWYASAQDSLT
jgi:hypothetical protein